MEEIREFLHRVWHAHGMHGVKGYAFLSYRGDDKEWCDVCFPPSDWKGDFEIPNDGKNLYFCPNLFSKPRRNKEYVLPSCWLYADLDEVNPRVIDPRPTIAWETSPKRYQALWQLEESLKPKVHRVLNKKLTYYLEADRSGWNPTRVLRVPGSTSTKYSEAHEVEALI